MASGSSSLLGDCHDGIANLAIASTPTKCPGYSLADFVACRDAIRILIEERLRGENHPRDAISALHGAVFHERVLQWMQLLAVAQALNGRDRTSLELRRRKDARIHCLAVD